MSNYYDPKHVYDQFIYIHSNKRLSWYVNKIKKKRRKQRINIPSSLGGENITREYIRDNWVAVQVYFRDFLVDVTQHEPKYDWTSFASDVNLVC